MKRYEKLMQLTYPIGDYLLESNLPEEDFNDIFRAWANLQGVLDSKIQEKKATELVSTNLTGSEITLIYNALTAYSEEQESHGRKHIAARCGDLAYKLHETWINHIKEAE